MVSRRYPVDLTGGNCPSFAASRQDPETPKTPKRVSLALGDEGTKSPRSEETHQTTALLRFPPPEV